jgi:CheY-like chemotaxis protein
MANKAYKEILVIDDDLELAKLYAEYFPEIGYKVDIALTIEMAMDKIDTHYYPWILLDSMGNGWRIIYSYILAYSINSRVIGNSGDMDVSRQMKKNGVYASADKDLEKIESFLK